MRLSDNFLNAKSNNFTALRLILASSVIYSHCYYVISHGIEADDLSPALGATVATYAVDGFFFLSGFLVYPSLLRLRNPLMFVMARLARLWPGLIFSIVVTVAGGLAYTTSPLGAYFRGNTLKYIVYNGTLAKAYYILTGIICGNQSCPVNFSIWSLPFEFRCYLILMALGALGIAANKVVMRAIVIATWIAAIMLDLPAIHNFITHELPKNLVFYIYTFQRLWALFSLGILAFLDRDKIRLHWWILALLAVAQLVAVQIAPAVQLQTRAILVGYAVLAFGLLTAKHRAVSASWPDYSYGTYLFGTPVMMAIYVVRPATSPYLISVETLLGSLALAIVSWHLVESPCLKAFATFRRMAPESRFGYWFRPARSIQ